MNNKLKKIIEDLKKTKFTRTSFISSSYNVKNKYVYFCSIDNYLIELRFVPIESNNDYAYVLDLHSKNTNDDSLIYIREEIEYFSIENILNMLHKRYNINIYKDDNNKNHNIWLNAIKYIAENTDNNLVYYNTESNVIEESSLDHIYSHLQHPSAAINVFIDIKPTKKLAINESLYSKLLTIAYAINHQLSNENGFKSDGYVYYVSFEKGIDTGEYVTYIKSIHSDYFFPFAMVSQKAADMFYEQASDMLYEYWSTLKPEFIDKLNIK